MATTLADILFALCAVAIVTAQWFILRSTKRGMTFAGEHGDAQASAGHPATPRRAALEWLYAIVPALALAVLLAFAWMAMHPDAMRVQGVAPGAIGMDT